MGRTSGLRAGRAQCLRANGQLVDMARGQSKVADAPWRTPTSDPPAGGSVVFSHPLRARAPRRAHTGQNTKSATGATRDSDAQTERHRATAHERKRSLSRQQPTSNRQRQARPSCALNAPCLISLLQAHHVPCLIALLLAHHTPCLISLLQEHHAPCLISLPQEHHAPRLIEARLHVRHLVIAPAAILRELA